MIPMGTKPLDISSSPSLFLHLLISKPTHGPSDANGQTCSGFIQIGQLSSSTETCPASPPLPPPPGATAPLPAIVRPMAAPPTPGSPTHLFPTMADIMAASRAQGLRVSLRTVGPLFRVTATRDGAEKVELGRAEGAVLPWPGGNVLHLDSMRMSRATLEVPDRPLFGLGLFLGAVAVRHGFDAGCVRAELLAINDSPLYHGKLVKFYTRMGFKAVHEVDGSSITDLAHMLVWGGRGTRMDADIEQLLTKWSKRFRSRD